MQPFARIDAVALPMPVPNVDTDQIIPARFLRKSRNDGLGQHPVSTTCASGDAGRDNPDFVLNRASYRGACILVADKNFGCGSSTRTRGLRAVGLRFSSAVVAPSFGDIFQGNCFQEWLAADNPAAGRNHGTLLGQIERPSQART